MCIILGNSKNYNGKESFTESKVDKKDGYDEYKYHKNEKNHENIDMNIRNLKQKQSLLKLNIGNSELNVIKNKNNSDGSIFKNKNGINGSRDKDIEGSKNEDLVPQEIVSIRSPRMKQAVNGLKM